MMFTISPIHVDSEGEEEHEDWLNLLDSEGEEEHDD